MKYRCGLVVLAVITLAIGSDTWADEVILKDGSRVIGTVKQLVDGSVTVETGFAGQITIDSSLIQGIVTEEPRSIQLPTGDRAIGNLDYDSSAGQRVSTATVGDVSIDLTRVDAIWAEGEENPAVVALLPKWYGHVEFGIDGETGNSERKSFNGRAEVHRDTPDDRMMIYAQGRASRENGEDTVKEILGGVSLEIDVDEDWFVFAKSELEFDKLEHLDLRATVTGGLGYFAIREPGHELKLRAGLGYQHESFSDEAGLEDDTNNFAVAELGLDYLLEVAPWLLYTLHATYFPTFEDVADYRIVVENAAEIPLNRDKDWRLRIGMKNNFDSITESDAEHLDTYYFMNLVWAWQ